MGTVHFEYLGIDIRITFFLYNQSHLTPGQWIPRQRKEKVAQTRLTAHQARRLRSVCIG